MMIVCKFRNGGSTKRFGPACQMRECLEELTSRFSDPDFIEYQIYRDDCQTLIWLARRE